MRPARATLCAVAVGLALAGCGGDDDEPADAGATGAQGASGVEGSATDVTAEEFLSKLLPEKELAVEGVVASEPACEGVKVEPALILVISDAATKAKPDTPLTELVEAEC
ncbi:MAG TPA: hypothetical protein VD766_01730 [Solirubrobacterales bacterium]|nr:hypothetical protein [Solirubrobacterales bacterium]